MTDKRRVVYSIVTAAIISIVLAAGFCLEQYCGVAFSSALFYFCAFLGTCLLTPVIYFFIQAPARALEKAGSVRPEHLKKFLIGCFVFIFFVWVICLLGVYPGFFNYDASEQWTMYVQSAVTAHHPVIHTYLLGFLLKTSLDLFNSATLGCFTYCVIQIIIADYAFCSVLSFLAKKGLPKLFLILSLLWCAFMPTNILLVLSTTKDSLFAPFFLLFTVKTIEALTDEAFWNNGLSISSWCISAFFATLLRNNAVYVMIPFMIFLIFFLRSKKKSRVLIAVLAAVIIFMGPVTRLITVKGINEKEFYSTPVQQVLRVYHNHTAELEADDKALVEYVFSGGEKEYEKRALLTYYPKISDYGKWGLNAERFSERKEEALNLWKKWGLKYPADYANAFLMLNYGFYYPFATLILDADGFGGYYSCVSLEPGASKIPFVGNIINHFAYTSYICSNPLTMWIFAPGTFFFIMFLTIVKCLYNKKREAIALIPAALVWLTFLLGPVALVRYVGFLFYLAPLEIGLWFRNQSSPMR